MTNPLFILSFFLFSCNGDVQKESPSLNEAKWYFYSYACDLTGYIQRDKVVNPIECGIQTKSAVKINKDSTEVFFNLYYKDTLNTCWLKPFALAGITIVRDTLFTPIYHQIIFTQKNDRTVLEDMNKQSLILQRKILENNDTVSTWLRTEAKKRKELSSARSLPLKISQSIN